MYSELRNKSWCFSWVFQPVSSRYLVVFLPRATVGLVSRAVAKGANAAQEELVRALSMAVPLGISLSIMYLLYTERVEKKTFIKYYFNQKREKQINYNQINKIWFIYGIFLDMFFFVLFFFLLYFVNYSPNSVSHWGVLTVRVKPLRSRCKFLSPSFFTAQGHKKRDSGGQNLRFACAKRVLGIFFCVSL